MIKLLIADDHELVREGLRKVFDREQDIELLEEASNASQVIAACRATKFDVVVVDFNMPGRSGLDLVSHLKTFQPDVPVLVLSMVPEKEFALRLLKAGADGFVSKQSAAEEIVAAVRRVASGKKYISDAVADQLANNIGQDAELLPHDYLSDREYQVLQLIATGFSTKEISDSLHLSGNTIATYRRRIMEKLGMKTDVDLTRYALKNNLVE